MARAAEHYLVMIRSIRMFAPVLVCVALAAACVKQQVVTPSASVGPSLLVEQFLRASNAKDLDAMARLFGTKDGPVAGRWPRDEIEKRMFVIATELMHEDFSVVGEQMVPGRGTDATRLMVKLTKNSNNYNVPFTLVRYKDTNWLIEQIGIEVLTAPR
jgi:hypothetical protein